MNSDKIVEIGPYRFYFNTLPYDKYLTHSWDRHDPYHMEAILYSCVVGYKEIGVKDDPKPLNVNHFEYEPGILISLVDYIYEESGFDAISSPEETAKNIKLVSTYLMSKQGVYDAFIFHHLGMDAWLKSRENPEIRIYLISITQLLTGIDVEERWKEAQKNNEPLDIIHTDQQREEIAQAEASNPQNRKRAVSEKMQEKAADAGLTENVAKQVQERLKQKLKEDKERYSNRKVAFDWMSDLKSEQQITQEENKALFSKLHHSRESEEFNT